MSEQELRLTQRLHEKIVKLTTFANETNRSTAEHLDMLFGQGSGEPLEKVEEAGTEVEALFIELNRLEWSLSYARELSLRLKEI